LLKRVGHLRQKSTCLPPFLGWNGGFTVRVVMINVEHKYTKTGVEVG
jgi:hypothetical protein